MNTVFLAEREGYDSFLYSVYESGNQGKAAYVNNQINGIRYFRIDRGKHGKIVIGIRADVEQVEIRAVFLDHRIKREVQDHSYGRETAENHHTPRKETLAEVMAVIGSHIYAENDLKTVMHHRLNVGEDSRAEHRGGQDHNDNTRKQREGRNVRHDRAAEFAVLHQENKGERIHRCGAELEGEPMPIIRPRECRAVIFHGSDQLLADLEKDHDDPSDENECAHGAVLCVAEEYDHTNRQRDRQQNGYNVPHAVKTGGFHLLRQTVVNQALKSRHSFFSFFKF